ncbi:unnamed protein product [Rotaria socialis]|uniref:Uncharacterized protein n=2 Tax=Rotaria socialis TaxID=392032 RepID=A0A818MXH2_9BILA|nr:unnamed protein product [Rotaria socialis]CAF3596472.1 unnamed protein product [Rotaria socialis]
MNNNINIFLDDMDLFKYESRRTQSITLDAGYVSVSSTDIAQSPKRFGLHGKKLICIIFTIASLVLVSFINLICLLWLMYRLDWSLFDSNGSKVFRVDKYNQKVEFQNQVSFEDIMYASKINNISQINVLLAKQIDISGDQNSILFDDDQILFNTDKFDLNNHSFIDFTNLHSLKFDNRIKTRVHLNQFNSESIRNKQLNISAINHLAITNIDHAFFYAENLLLEADRHNRRSVLRFGNLPARIKYVHHYQKTLLESLHLKSDSVFFDLPRLPLLANTHRSESGIYRICICNTTFLFLRSSAHQPCPLF